MMIFFFLDEKLSSYFVLLFRFLFYLMNRNHKFRLALTKWKYLKECESSCVFWFADLMIEQ